mmetsp:Transcript_105212/g.280082  ORF Transcript_105212/g.280082 Transcript_105212/m.280082 type:complete len:509 (-) Transcript_105212:48-1574(-)
MEGIVESAKRIKENVAETTGAAAGAVHDSFLSMKEDAQEAYSKVADQFHSKRADYQDFMEKYLKIKLRKQALKLIDRIPGYIKGGLEDPYMPGCVKRRLHHIIDTIWPDVRVELVWEMQVMVDGDDEEYKRNLEFGYKPDCLRAFLRYRLFPYNRSTFYCLRDPVFVIVNILALIPYMGIYAWMYAFIWVIIDKTDEYQLIYYILSFKGAQFFTWGILKGFVGFSMYFYCTTFPPIDQLVTAPQTLAQRTASSCELYGPGMSEKYWVSIMSWLLPLVLVWVSLLLLPFSKEKGRSELKTFTDQQTMKEVGDEVAVTPSMGDASATRKQGGYLRRMLIFDFIIFCLCVGIMALIIALQHSTSSRSKWEAFYNAQDSDWQVKQTLFFCQWMYGTLSIIFLPFVLPFFQAVLTHSAPTAYNEDGQCCKFTGAEKPHDKLSLDEEESKLSENETKGIMDGFTNIANGNGVNKSFFSAIDLRQRVVATGKGGPADEAAAPAAQSAGEQHPTTV